VPTRSRGKEPLDELRKVVRGRAQLLVFDFDGGAFEGIRREFREHVERFLDHAVSSEHRRNDDHLSHLVRMADRTLHRYGAAHAVADEVRPRDIELLEQRRHIVGEVFVGDVAFGVRRAPVALHFDGNHLPRFGELADPPGPVVGDGHERAVEQHHRFAAAVDFVVHFDAVDWCVARRWLLLRRHDSRHKHHEEESRCPHVWCYSVGEEGFESDFCGRGCATTTRRCARPPGADSSWYFETSFVMATVSSLLKAARSVADRKRTSVSTAKVARRLPASFARRTWSPTSRTTRAPRAMRELADSLSISRFGSAATGPRALGETT